MSAPRPRLVIVGQGLAGSWLGWTFEQAGVPFRIIDAATPDSASRVSAGLIVPLTGRRLAPTWRFAEWREAAIAAYRKLGDALALPLLHELSVRRVYRDAAERARFEARLADPAVAAWVERRDEQGLWLRGGVRVEIASLLTALRERWKRDGWLEEATVAAVAPGDTVIWCTGSQPPAAFDFVPWERSHGEIIRSRGSPQPTDALVSDGQWLLTQADGDIVVGATYQRQWLHAGPTPAGRGQLQQAAQRLGDVELTVEQHEAGIRVTTPDRRPVLGWHPRQPGCGILGGLGSKGALWAPLLAAQWLALWRDGRPPDSDLDVARFGG